MVFLGGELACRTFAARQPAGRRSIIIGQRGPVTTAPLATSPEQTAWFHNGLRFADRRRPSWQFPLSSTATLFYSQFAPRRTGTEIVHLATPYSSETANRVLIAANPRRGRLAGGQGRAAGFRAAASSVSGRNLHRSRHRHRRRPAGLAGRRTAGVGRRGGRRNRGRTGQSDRSWAAHCGVSHGDG